MLKSSLTKLTLRMGQALGLAVVSCTIAAFAPVQAQVSSTVDPLEDFQIRDGGSDLFDGDSQNDIQDLIHKINQINDLSMEEFVIQRQDNIMTEADRFRELQRDRIQSNQSEEPTVDFTLETDSDIEN